MKTFEYSQMSMKVYATSPSRVMHMSASQQDNGSWRETIIPRPSVDELLNTYGKLGWILTQQSSVVDPINSAFIILIYSFGKRTDIQ